MSSRHLCHLVSLLLLLSCGGVLLRSQVVTYTISGSFTAVPGDTFGLTTAPAALSGTMTVNLALNTSTFYVAAGNTLVGGPAAHDFYGFSLSSIVSMSFTTGTKTWTKADIDPMRGDADILASSDLTTAPAYVGITFLDGNDNNFSIGRFNGGPSSSYLNTQLQLLDNGTGNEAGGDYTAIVSAVPEPSTYAAIFGACALVAGAAWKRRRRG